jgi:hypothetical protein
VSSRKTKFALRAENETAEKCLRPEVATIRALPIQNRTTEIKAKVNLRKNRGIKVIYLPSEETTVRYTAKQSPVVTY